jgi:hypothetical protein
MSVTVRYITLTNTNEPAIVDRDDYERVIGMGDWYKNDGGYAVRRYRHSTLRMHRFIMNTPKGLHTDHINHDRLDNRKSNLRAVSAAMNAQNNEGSIKTIYKDLPKGVTFDYTRNKYLATRTLRRRFNTLGQAIKFTKESKDL